MDTTELQTRLPGLTHLLPSQREWLERLLFQLAFNDSQQVDILGAEGSGKSTLAMAVAELFSEQYNIALLSAGCHEDQVADQLMQQWFGLPAQPDIALAEQLSIADSQLPLAVVIDDAERYSAALMQQISAAPCLRFCFASQSQDNAGLTLTLNRITTADAEQLLQHQTLNSIELAERLANANGNIHLLLKPVNDKNTAAEAKDTEATASLKKSWLYIAAAAVLLVIVAYLFWPAQDEPKQARRLPVQQQEQAVSSESEMPTDVIVAEPDIEDEAAKVAAETSSETIVAEQLITEPAALPAEPEIDVTPDMVEETSDDTAPVIAEPVSNEILYQHDEVQLLALQKQQIAVQLAVLSSEAALERFKRTYPQLATLSYQRNWQGKMQLVLLLAPFDDSKTAKTEMKQLPEALLATGPFVKTLQAIQTEIQARQFSQLPTEQE